VPPFVDLHSHVIPSGDDGAQTLAEGLELCRQAAAHGTRVLYGTPHVLPGDGLGMARERRVRRAHEELGPRARALGVDLRLGFELTPAPALLEEDLWRYALQGLDAVLVEFPFRADLDVLLAVAERAEAQGLLPLLAHPERAAAVLDDPERAQAFAARGWPLQVNATSLLGRHGAEPEALGWDLVEAGLASAVASDAHGSSRPPRLDEAFALVAERMGETAAERLFDASALAGVAAG
jgi:protein-tyrosine phosphatase